MAKQPIFKQTPFLVTRHARPQCRISKCFRLKARQELESGRTMREVQFNQFSIKKLLRDKLIAKLAEMDLFVIQSDGSLSIEESSSCSECSERLDQQLNYLSVLPQPPAPASEKQVEQTQ